MDWLDRMNGVMTYIEQNLRGTIDYDRAAAIACCSTYQLQRMFPFITEVTLSEYVRRRRLTLAAFELQQGGGKVVDIALNYGYDSPEAFARAFKKMHGVIPADARKPGVRLKAYPRMSFHISIKGDAAMNYRVEEKPGMEMFGRSARIRDLGESAFTEVPEFWSRCIADGTVDQIRRAAGLGENGQIHAALYRKRGDEFSYLIGYPLPADEVSDEFERLAVPPQTYAIFSTGLYPDGESGIRELWKRIWSEWFPTSDYEAADGAEFEMTYDRGQGMYEIKVWIPVAGKMQG